MPTRTDSHRPHSREGEAVDVNNDQNTDQRGNPTPSPPESPTAGAAQIAAEEDEAQRELDHRLKRAEQRTETVSTRQSHPDKESTVSTNASPVESSQKSKDSKLKTPTVPRVSRFSKFANNPRPSSTTSSRTTLRSPPNKRPPASRSSHGIETSTGPPPALSTQRSYNLETIRRSQNRPKLSIKPQQSLQSGLAGKSTDHSSNGIISRRVSRQLSQAKEKSPSTDVTPSTKQSPSSSPPKMDTSSQQSYEDDFSEGEQDPTLRGGEGSALGLDLRTSSEGSGDYMTGSSSHGTKRAEDLFLNLAQQDADSPATRTERRRSRIALPSHRSSMPPNSFSSPVGRPSSSGVLGSALESGLRPRANSNLREQSTKGFSSNLSPTHKHSSSAGLPGYAYSAHPLSSPEPSFNHRPPSAVSRASQVSVEGGHSPDSSQFHDAVQYHARRESGASNNPSYTQSYRPSNLSFSGPRLFKRQENLPETPRADGTESTTSTTAPSTVWDELDDLKSRIHKLELTGKLPSSSGAAISRASGERPRTATTTVTTASSSPKRDLAKKLSPTSPISSGLPSPTVHPLLHAALAKSRPLLNPEVYKTLEATASDAISLATLVGQPGTINSGASVVGDGGYSDRQVRRKVDSMCRSLTELCIALSDGKTDLSSPVHARRETIAGSEVGERETGSSLFARHRGISEEPEISGLIRSNSRALTRLEQRRTSLISASGGTRGFGAESATPTAYNKLGRPSTILLRDRKDDMNDTASVRAPSRATTEVNHTRSPRDRIPREYTSQHPLPDRSPSVQSALPVRRSGISPSTSMPIRQGLASGTLQSGRRFLERSTPTYDRSREAPRDSIEQRTVPSLLYNTGTRSRAGSVGRTATISRSSTQPQIASSPLESRFAR